LLKFIPRKLKDSEKQSPNTFVRKRKLPVEKLVTFILFIVCSSKSLGIDIKSGQFFRAARRNGLWTDAEAVHRSAVTKARGKLPWGVFASLLGDAVELAYDIWPSRESDTWHDMSVFAIDGSKYQLPSSDEIRQVFDPLSGLCVAGKGHYPQCLVSTVYDVFRCFPVARTVVPIAEGNEREQAEAMLSQIPPGGVLLHDRGYPSFEYINVLNQVYEGFYIIRCPAKSTFPAVERFVQSNQDEMIVLVDPSNNYLKEIPIGDRAGVAPIQLRMIRLTSPDGTVSVLLTNLFDERKFSRDEIVQLYFRRWAIEDHYRSEKIYLDIVNFHSKTENGVRQELFAVLIMSVIARIMMIVSTSDEVEAEPQFKNAVMTMATEAALLVPDDPCRAVEVFKEALSEIARVKYYRTKEPRLPQPRVSRQPISKWQQGRGKKLKAA